MGNLGEEKRTGEILPLEWPVKREQPQPEPEQEPVTVPAEKEEEDE